MTLCNNTVRNVAVVSDWMVTPGLFGTAIAKLRNCFFV